jgi:hypothetical protein
MDWRENFDGSLLDKDALGYLVQFGGLGDAAVGITKKVMSGGLSSLSEKQAYVFKVYVVDEWLTRKCKCGDHDVEGHELIGLWSNDGYCSRCAHRMQKDD